MFLRGCSDHRDQLFCLFEWGGVGWYSQKNWEEVYGSFPAETLTLLLTKICDCPSLIYDLTKNSTPSAGTVKPKHNL